MTDEFEVTEEECDWFVHFPSSCCSRVEADLLSQVPTSARALVLLQYSHRSRPQRSRNRSSNFLPPPSAGSTSTASDVQHVDACFLVPSFPRLTSPPFSPTVSSLLPPPHDPSVGKYQPRSSSSTYSSSNTPLSHPSLYSNTPSSHDHTPSSHYQPAPQPPLQAQQLPPSQHDVQTDFSSLNFPLDIYGQAGFADGATEDIQSGGGEGGVQAAFKEVDFGTFTLTPAVGSDESSSSLEEWIRQQR